MAGGFPRPSYYGTHMHLTMVDNVDRDDARIPSTSLLMFGMPPFFSRDGNRPVISCDDDERSETTPYDSLSSQP